MSTTIPSSFPCQCCSLKKPPQNQTLFFNYWFTTTNESLVCDGLEGILQTITRFFCPHWAEHLFCSPRSRPESRMRITWGAIRKSICWSATFSGQLVNLYCFLLATWSLMMLDTMIIWGNTLNSKITLFIIHYDIFFRSYSCILQDP